MLTDKKPRPTGMAVAFYQALVRKSIENHLIRQIQGSINRNVGLVREREVNAKVSYRTAQALRSKGVLE